MSRRVAGPLLVVAAAALGCAQPQAPPGGDPDRIPPRVLSTTPVPFDTLTDFDEPVVIRFNERISERLQGVAELRDAVIVSPETSPVRVERGRRSIEVSLIGGWQPGLVYRVVILPVFRDLFNNLREQPVELVFSTGAPIPETAIGGLLEDPITGTPVAAARVEATRRLDRITYVAVSDTGGFFALRNVPAGAYDMRAWLDQDRDRDPDFLEPQDTDQTVVGAADTVIVQMALLPSDTTPARLARAEPVDSLRLRLLFDDYFAVGPVDGRAALYSLPDSVFVTDDIAFLHGARLDSLLAVERALADSLRALERARADSLRADSIRMLPDSLRPDTLAADSAVVDTAGRAAPPRTDPRQPQPAQPRPGQQPRPMQQQGRASEPRPSRELILILPAPLTPGAPYVIVVDGVTNIRGVPGGGGSARFRVPEAPPDTAVQVPDTIPADTVPAPGGGGRRP